MTRRFKNLGRLVLGVGALVALTNPACGGGDDASSTTVATTASTSGSETTGSMTSTTTATMSASSGMGGMTSSSTGMGGMTSSSTSAGGGGSSCLPTGPLQGQIAPAVNGGFKDAFDATPDSDATTIYFTGIDAMGNAGVFKQGICPAAPVAPVYTGGAFEAPFGIAMSSDDKTLFVADLSAEEDPVDPKKDNGVLFSLPALGGTAPSILVGSVRPRGLTVVAESGVDQVYFTGIDKANGLLGVFKIAAGGGAVTTIAEGAPFVDPSALTVSSTGDIYVLDTSAASGRLASVIRVQGGAAAELVGGLQSGYPAGIAITKDDSTLFVSGLDAGASSDVLYQITIATKSIVNMTAGIGTFGEAAGMHRAKNGDLFAWVDTKAQPMGLAGVGTVFVIK